MTLPRSQFMDTAAYAYTSLPEPHVEKPDQQAVISGHDFKDTPAARRYFKKLVKKAEANLPPLNPAEHSVV